MLRASEEEVKDLEIRDFEPEVRNLLGLTRDEVKERMGIPDDVEARQPPRIFLYGSWEIHFDDGFVWLVFNDPEKGGSGTCYKRKTP